MVGGNSREKVRKSFFDSYGQHVGRPYVDFLDRLRMDFEPGPVSGAVMEERSGWTYVDGIGRSAM
jgi:hypothetical protein